MECLCSLEYPTVLGKHLLCASVECGLPSNKVFGVKSDVLMKALESKGLIQLRGSTWVGKGTSFLLLSQIL